MQRQQPLQLGLDAVLLQAGVDPELVRVVVQDRLDGEDELLAGLVGDRPGAGAVDELVLEAAGRAHPVQRLVGAVVGVDGHRAVGLDQQEAGRHRQVGGEPSDVVDGAAGNDQAHGGRRYRAPGTTSAPPSSWWHDDPRRRPCGRRGRRPARPGGVRRAGAAADRRPRPSAVGARRRRRGPGAPGRADRRPGPADDAPAAVAPRERLRRRADHHPRSGARRSIRGRHCPICRWRGSGRMRCRTSSTVPWRPGWRRPPTSAIPRSPTPSPPGSPSSPPRRRTCGRSMRSGGPGGDGGLTDEQRAAREQLSGPPGHADRQAIATVALRAGGRRGRRRPVGRPGDGLVQPEQAWPGPDLSDGATGGPSAARA